MNIPLVDWKPSPNFGFGRQGYAIRAEVKHRIVGTLASATRRFVDMNSDVSTHFGIGYIDGTLSIHQYVDLADWAWGNGDVREPSWPRLIPGVNPNLYTVSTEHEDGGEANRGRISDEVWDASIHLSRILRCGDVERIRKAGIRCRDPQIAAQLAAMPIDTGSYIDHNQIAGPNKPYCLRAWLDDPGFVAGSPSRRDRLLQALRIPLEDDVAPVTLLPVRQDWTTGVGDLQASSRTAPPGGQFFTGGPGLGERKWFVTAERVTSIAETTDGLWRLVLYGSELLWMHRYNLRPIEGERYPAEGFGLSFDGGITEEEAKEREKKAAGLGARYVAGAAAKAAEDVGG